MDFLGPGDLLKRWSYTRGGIHKLSKNADFPKPAMVINAGRTKVWARADIEAYEKNHPEVLDTNGGFNKQRGYFLCLARNKPAERLPAEWLSEPLDASTGFSA